MEIKLGRDSIIVSATKEHAETIVSIMRAEDRREAYAMGFSSIEHAMALTFDSTRFAWTWLIEGRVGCIFGVTRPSLLCEEEQPWFVSTDEVVKHRMHFLRHCRYFIREMRDQHPVLGNVVDARYTSCVLWLKWLGFTVHAPEPMGTQGLLFHKFEMRK